MRVVKKFIKHLIIVLLFFISYSAFSQPPFTPPGQGGGPPPNPCRGRPGTPPCPVIPISEGIGLLIAAGALLGVRKLHSRTKEKL